jgi:hypothetical protein
VNLPNRRMTRRYNCAEWLMSTSWLTSMQYWIIILVLITCASKEGAEFFLFAFIVY